MKHFIALFILFLSCSVVNAETPDKWEGYIEFTGRPGTTRSLGVSDLLVPLWQDQNDMSFLNVRGLVGFDTDEHEVNIGLGHRHMFNDFILGGYAFYDKSESDLGFNYDQWTLGLEMLGEKWDIRMNGYIADENENEWGRITQSSSEVGISPDDQDIWVDYQQTLSYYKERSLSGFDGEVGYKLPVLDDTRVYAGGYHFIGEDGFESVSGPRVRLETRLYDLPYLGNGSRVMLGVESQYDDPRGSQTSGLLSIRIPFGVESKNQKAKLKGLDRRMMEPVVRDIDIVTTENNFVEKQTGQSEALNLEGLAYTKVMRYTVEELGNLKADIELETGKGELPLVVIRTSDTQSTYQPNSEDYVGGATYAIAGKLLKVGYRNPFNKEISKSSFTPTGETPTLVFTRRILSAFELENDRVHINGWEIDATGYHFGVTLEESGTYFITNSTIKNATTAGLFIDGADTKLVLTDSSSSFNGNVNGTGLGIRILNGAELIADNVEIMGNQSLGVGASGEGTIVSIKNSRINDNYSFGLGMYDGVTATISEGTIIDGNGENVDGGIDVRGDGNTLLTSLTIRDSIVSNNFEHGIKLRGHIKFTAENIDVFGNGKLDALAGHGISAVGLEGGLIPDVTISNSRLYDNDSGIEAKWGANVTVKDSTKIYNNRYDGILVAGPFSASDPVTTFNINNSFVYNNGGSGIEVIVGQDSSRRANLTIHDTEIIGNLEDGLHVKGGEVTVMGGIISGNGGHGINAETGNEGAKTWTRSTGWVTAPGLPSVVTVTGTQIKDNAKYGIWAHGLETTVNIFTSSNFGNIFGSYLKDSASEIFIDSQSCVPDSNGECK